MSKAKLILPTIRSTRKGNSDPRYKRGIFVGFDPQTKARRVRQLREQIAARHPLSHGWTFSHHNEELDAAVYLLGQAKMAYIAAHEAWVVDFGSGDRQAFYTGTMAQITVDVKQVLGLTTNGQTRGMEV